MAGTDLTEREWILTETWWNVREFPGWLAGMWKSLEMTTPEIEMLEAMDDSFLIVDRALADWMKENERQRRHGIFGISDDEAVGVLSAAISDIYTRIERALKRDVPFAEVKLIMTLSDLQGLEKQRYAARGRIVHRLRPTDETRISDHDIARARQFPLENLIPEFEMSKFGYIKCRWHDDSRPSMLVKGGFGFCFTCRKSIDAIGWLMEIDGHTFADAVKKLRGN